MILQPGQKPLSCIKTFYNEGTLNLTTPEWSATGPWGSFHSGEAELLSRASSELIFLIVNFN